MLQFVATKAPKPVLFISKCYRDDAEPSVAKSLVPSVGRNNRLTKTEEGAMIASPSIFKTKIKYKIN